MTLQNRLKALYEPFQDDENISCAVYHYTRGDDTTLPYCIWSETGEENSFNVDNHKEEQQLTGLVDYYTLDEFDSICDDIQTILDNEHVGWVLESVQFEEETNLIHYQWRWWTNG